MKILETRSAGDPALADYRSLRDPARLRRGGTFLVEGREAVRVFLGSPGFAARSILVTHAALEALREDFESAEELRDGETPVFLTPPEVLREVTGFRFHQGCLAAGRLDSPATTLRPADVTRIAARERPGSPLLILEDVTDPDNVGSVFRNAFALGAGGVLLTGGCASPLYRKSIRTSLGTVFRVPFCHDGSVADPVRQAVQAGFEPVALHPDAPGTDRSTPLGHYAPRSASPPAWIVGNEGRGLSREALELAERIVSIEMEPEADSINVAAATAVALHASRSDSKPGSIEP